MNTKSKKISSFLALLVCICLMTGCFTPTVWAESEETESVGSAENIGTEDEIGETESVDSAENIGTEGETGEAENTTDLENNVTEPEDDTKEEENSDDAADTNDNTVNEEIEPEDDSTSESAEEKIDEDEDQKGESEEAEDDVSENEQVNTIPVSYEIEIPVCCSLNQDSGTNSFKISAVCAGFAEEDRVDVSFSSQNDLHLAYGAFDSVEYILSSDGIRLANNSTVASFNEDGGQTEVSVEVAERPSFAGTYQDVITFSVAFIPGT